MLALAWGEEACPGFVVVVTVVAAVMVMVVAVV